MSDHPLLHYKPGLTMDEPVTVAMGAADWATFMVWLSIQNTEGVNHLIYGVIAPQVTEQLYTTDSVKAAEAIVAARRAGPFGMPGVGIVQFPAQSLFPDPDDFKDEDDD